MTQVSCGALDVKFQVEQVCFSEGGVIKKKKNDGGAWAYDRALEALSLISSVQSMFESAFS